MSAQIIDGVKIAQKSNQELHTAINELKAKGCNPHLSVILVGDDPASKVYVGMKQKDCEKNGMSSETIRLSAETSEQELLDLITKLNNDDKVHGILVQLPIPKHIDEKKVIESINPEKDVDGFHPVNRGRLAVGDDCFLPCTPAGMQKLLIEYGIETKGKHVVVVGRSAIVGMPFSIMMAQKKEGANSTVTICHTGSGDLKPYTLQADILVAAAGWPKTITREMVKPGTVIIDVGVNRVDAPDTERGYKLVGDVDYENVLDVASAITPVPGGVGPMTRAMLLANTVKAAQNLCK